jgi:DNA-binding NarL/FixJ family response regulator
MDRPPTDGRRLLDFVAEAESAALSSWGEARELILTALQTLIPCDLVACCEGPGTSLVWTATEPSVVEPRVREIDFWFSCYRQIPCLVHWDKFGNEDVVRFSDHVSQRAYRRTPIHDHFYRPFGLDHVLVTRIALPTGHLIDFGCESGRRDFADRNVALLERLRPYLTAIVSRAHGGALALQLRSTFALTRREAEVLALLVRGKSNQTIATTLFVSSATIRKHLEHLYTKLGVKTRTGAANRALGACQAPDSSVRLNDLLGSDLAPRHFRSSSRSSVHLHELLGLTPRELRVLELASQGATNGQIAANLAVATGTVKNHLEHAYAKLKVASRTEASVRILTLGLLDTTHPPPA